MEAGLPPGDPGARRLSRKDRTPSVPLRLADLDPTTRRRALLRCGLTIGLAWVLVLGGFYVVPIGHESGLRAFLRLGADIAIIGVVFAWQIRRISLAALPELRAIEALGIVIVLFLVAFSGIYLGMSHETPLTFTQPLDQTKALYFTITIFSTVGFGDITPRTDAARLVVSAQMLLDLAIIGAVVRLIFNAARSRITPGAEPTAATER
jgi:voltage-gated potassium channel